ncbi:MAG TPA: SNF2-related protein, partial [Flavitalea sp.]|nr:SNF2-related protein [Flavitalea sp.]
MTITETSKGFEISFPYDHTKVAAIKNIPGAWFNSTMRTWNVPRHRSREIDNLKRRFGVSTLRSAEVMLEEQYDQIPELPALTMDLKSVGLIRPLFSFQEPGVAYCLEKKKTIIGDQMGLGKTSQAIAAVLASQNFPCLVICPSTLKLNWQKEWNDVAGRRALLLNDKVKNTWQKYQEAGFIDVFIVNFESLKKYFVAAIRKEKDESLKLRHIIFREASKMFKSVLIDESHRCKDGTTQQAKFVMGLTKNREMVLELTGTPLVNKPKDLIPQLIILDKLQEMVSHLPDITGKDKSGYRRFLDRYCEGGSGAAHLKELNYRLNKICFYRREKSEVLKDLPPKSRNVILCDITNREEYDKAENEFVKYLREIKGCDEATIRRKLRGEVMVQMGILKQISARGKMEAVREHVEEVLENGEKLILFCHLREIVANLKSYYPDAVTITGSDTMESRQLSVDRFQKDPKVSLII